MIKLINILFLLTLSFGLLNFALCSSAYDKPVLTRQTNSPNSQAQLRKMIKKCNQHRATSVGYEALERAWAEYLEGKESALMELITEEGFDPNVSVGVNTLLQAAILRNDADLVSLIVSLPGIDLKYAGISGIEPIEMATDKPEIQEILLDAFERISTLRR